MKVEVSVVYVLLFLQVILLPWIRLAFYFLCDYFRTTQAKVVECTIDSDLIFISDIRFLEVRRFLNPQHCKS